MPDIPSDEEDSRVASMATQRNRGNASASGSNRSSRHTSREPPSKRQRRTRRAQPTNVQDFVPRGATFSENSLEVDPDTESTSDSGSDDSSESSSGSESASASESNNEKETESNARSGDVSASTPAPNWNKTGRGVIRTSLRGPQNANANTGSEAAAAKKFEAVNAKYWRSRSSSVSSQQEVRGTEEVGKGDTVAASENDTEMEEGEVNGDQLGSAESQSGDSDGSGSLDSEADDSILLNIGLRGNQSDVISISDDGEVDGYDPESLPVSQAAASVDIFDNQNGIEDDSATDSKESAFLRFAQKYPNAPSVLADLDREDMELQARIIFYDRDINDINLQLPIMCMECLREGHLSEVCPMKECVHCGAWGQHQSSLCPRWRRCQKCRERSHDQQQCPSALKSSAAEIPCDLCGSSEHLEFDCDFLWKLPRQDITATPVLVSISCAHCTSNRHLIGDCPSLTRPFPSSSFTVRGIEPNLITNINSVVDPRRGGGPGPTAPSGGQRGLKIRGRAAHSTRSPSPDSDDMMSMSMSRGGGGKRGGPGSNRNANRGNINIRIGNNSGRNGPPPPPSARDYRDREDPYPRGYNSRQRSMSPGRDRGRPSRGRGGWQPPSRSPSRGQGRPPGPSRPGRGGGGRGGGRGGGGGKRGGGGDAYRPMPSAAKKAWDRYRL